MSLTQEQKTALTEELPQWAVKPHPTKSNMSAIHPMAIIDRLNEVFGVGGWDFRTEFISSTPFVQKTKNGERDMFRSAVKGSIFIKSLDLTIEQFGGSSNDDEGDALKGGATDALTKIASYLGIGASIYKGQGNVSPEPILSLTDALKKVSTATSVDELNRLYKSLPINLQKDDEIIAKCKEVKEDIQAIN